MGDDHNSFYLVWCPDKASPTRMHSYRERAEAEAKRLAANNPGRNFYVLKAITVARKVDVEVITLDDDEIPF